MKANIKRLTGTAIAALTTLTYTLPVYADTSLNPCEKTPDPWNKLCNINKDNLPGVIGTFIVILFIVAALVALLFLIWGGIKWIMSGGDKGKVETARSTIIAALIGLVITFLAFFLLSFILSLFGLSVTNLVIPNFT